MQDKLKAIIKAFNDGQDKYYAAIWDKKIRVNKKIISKAKRTIHLENQIKFLSITDFLLHWKHRVGKVLFSEKMVDEKGFTKEGYRKNLERIYDINGNLFKRIYGSKSIYVNEGVKREFKPTRPAFAFHLGQAFKAELSGGLKGLVGYFYDELSNKREPLLLGQRKEKTDERKKN